MYPEKNKMILSLNCLILGQASDKCFAEDIGEKYYDDTSDFPNKRTKLEDRTSDFLNLLLCPFDTEIDCTNVEQFLSAKLPLKLPCFPGLVMGYTDVIEDTFSSSIYSSRLSLIVGEVMSASFKQISGGEARTLGNIDVHIRKIIELAQEYEENCSDLDLDRNKTIKSTTTTTEHPRSRPDMTIYYKNVLFMMGEEKDLDGRLEAAEKQLDGYFDFWNPLAFGKLPFVMAFVAAGIKLQFYYYYPNNNNVPVRVRIGNTINLGTTNRMNNFKALQYTINAIRIIRTWDLKQYIRHPEIKLYEVIQRRNGTTVTINPKKVIKKLHIEKREPAYKKFLKFFYENIFPKFDNYKLLESKYHAKWIILEFAPVGYMAIPKDEDELRYAIWSVLKSVMILHANEIVHRDIRWENVMRLTDNSWVLIDFEEAAPIGRGNRSTPILNIAAPEYRGMESDPCRAAGDIWMIGNLLNDLRILQIQLSARARNFRDRLTQQNHDERPSAADAIDDDWFSDM
ncbi:unnamed protein product [Rhizophagus irregularis]|uniref:Protein kinase domain-containing protein n=1 Tax=Rhizophagus irregularis TaxID=588596 RepID=A0A915ZRF0_9GLOM|nr:unnamed protein product [Rhizophagus irregularis]